MAAQIYADDESFLASLDKSGHDHHYHKDERGLLHICYHKCRNAGLSPSFWVGFTMGFPVEHLIWTGHVDSPWLWSIIHWIGQV